MKEMEIMSDLNTSLESEEHNDSGHVSKPVHRFYFVKHWPTDPDSISLIKKKESVIEKMNQDIREINGRIEEKMLERNHLYFRLENLTYWRREWRNRKARKEKILNQLHVALEDLYFISHSPKRRSNKTCFTGEFDNRMLNSLMLHGSKSLAEEKQILRNVNIRERDGASFKSLEMLKETIRWNIYLNNWQKLLREIEQFQIQCERPGNASVKGKISNSESLRKAIKDEIKHLCDDSSENRKNMIAHATQVMHSQKELKSMDQKIHSLKTKLIERRQKKAQAYESISKLNKFYGVEVMDFYKYCSVINKVHQLAKEKDVAALDELSHSEVGKFMLEWNSNKALREDYEKKVVHSLERRQLSIDGRRRHHKSCLVSN